MKRKEENRSVIEPSCTFFKPSKINFLPLDLPILCMQEIIHAIKLVKPTELM
jgi:hypothetical protein